jgi:hypothetical protein
MGDIHGLSGQKIYEIILDRKATMPPSGARSLVSIDNEKDMRGGYTRECQCGKIAKTLRGKKMREVKLDYKLSVPPPLHLSMLIAFICFSFCLNKDNESICGKQQFFKLLINPR